MPGSARGLVAGIAIAGLAALAGCEPGEDGTVTDVPGQPGRLKSTAEVRAARRAYDGAPPVIPHASFGAACVSCHNDAGLEVPDVGYAPAMPHGQTAGISETSRCRQCHVFREAEDVFVESAFQGLAQDLRHGTRLYEGAPPVIPHGVFMRERCVACHAGPAAREEIRTSHPERTRCLQCHVEASTPGAFSRAR